MTGPVARQGERVRDGRVTDGDDGPAGAPVDLARLREGIADGTVRSVPVGGGDIAVARRLELPDGRRLFLKSLPDAPPGLFAAEAAGLRWLADGLGGGSAEQPTGDRAHIGLAVPPVLAVDDSALVLPWIEPGRPSAASAADAGRGLARLHAAGSPVFGRVDPALPGWTGLLPRDDTPEPDWPTFYARRRLLPTLAAAEASGGIRGGDADAVRRVADRVSRLAGPPEPPARLHGDLWSGNLHPGADGRTWLIDPAAHGGHRETDLALLALFGAPGLGTLLAAYDASAPLAAGWRSRVGLHQLYPLLVHAALFGGGYGPAAGRTARDLA